MRLTSTTNRPPSNTTLIDRAETQPDEATPTGSPGVSTACGVDELIDGHRLDVPLPATTEPPSEAHADSAPQESATNIPHLPGQIIIPIRDQPPTLTRNQIIAVNHGPSPDHPLVRLLRSDLGALILAYVKPQSLNLIATHENETLQAILHLHNRLKYVNKDLNALISGPPYNAETEAIRWLQKLNRVTATFYADQKPHWTPDGREKLRASATARASAANLSQLIRTEFDIDVRLPNQPHANRRRTELLAQRLALCADAPRFSRPC
jgi:hypothetical protein